MATHERAGSSQSMFGGTFYRYCLCGAEFTGTAEETFEARERHLDEILEHLAN